MADEILKELWKIKDAIANEHGFDVRALAAYLQAKKHDDKQIVDLRAMKKKNEQPFQRDPNHAGLIES